MPRIQHRAALVAALLLGGLAGPLSSASADQVQVLKLDSHSPANLVTSPVAPVSTVSIPAGEPYVLTVTGTAGIWALAPGATTPLCGVPDAAPMEPSPGVPAEVAGWDSETVYGSGAGFVISPLLKACSTLALPVSTQGRSSGFEISNGGGFFKPVAFGGSRSVPRADHTYSYQVIGTGAAIGLRFADAPVFDNSGIFTVTVRTQAQCDAINCLGNQTPQSDAAAVPAPTAVAAPGAIAVLGTRTCNIDKVLSLRPAQKKGIVFAKTVYYINDKKLRTVIGQKIFILHTKNVRAQKFRNLPSGTLAVKLVITTTKGQTFTVKKSVARCEPRIKARPVIIS